MSTETLFYYRRPGEGGEVWDCFNVFRIVRGWWSTPEIFSVTLDDGHEEARDTERTNTKNGKPRVEVVRERGWYLTQISMNKEDAERLRKATELYPHGQFILDKVNAGVPEQTQPAQEQ